MEKKSYISIGGIDYYPNNGDIHLIRCPKCNRENYCMAVLSGICAWCGYNANQDNELKKQIK